MDCCNVYINEKSLMAQCADLSAVEKGLKTIIDCLSLIDRCSDDAVSIQKYYCGGVFQGNLSREHSLQNLPNKDLKTRFRKAIKDAKIWEAEPLSDMKTVYVHEGVDVSWSSMSEAYEQQSPILINMVDSTVKEPVAVVEKQEIGKVEIDSYSDIELLSELLITRKWRKREYDLSSVMPPRDNETILTDTARFEPTDHSYQGRVMYRRIGTNHLCYVDNKHCGAAAHIEEFNEVTKKQVRKLKINADEEYKPLTTTEKERLLRFDGR